MSLLLASDRVTDLKSQISEKEHVRIFLSVLLPGIFLSDYEIRRREGRVSVVAAGHKEVLLAGGRGQSGSKSTFSSRFPLFSNSCDA